MFLLCLESYLQQTTAMKKTNIHYLPFIKSAKLEQIVSGITYFPFPIFSNSLYILSPSKGYNPVVILYLEKNNSKF